MRVSLFEMSFMPFFFLVNEYNYLLEPEIDQLIIQSHECRLPLLLQQGKVYFSSFSLQEPVVDSYQLTHPHAICK
jgi:hypothetical protein